MYVVVLKLVLEGPFSELVLGAHVKGVSVLGREGHQIAILELGLRLYMIAFIRSTWLRSTCSCSFGAWTRRTSDNRICTWRTCEWRECCFGNWTWSTHDFPSLSKLFLKSKKLREIVQAFVHLGQNELTFK